MELNLSDTIAARATPAGPGAIGIIRISGADSEKIVRRLFFPCNMHASLSLTPRRMILGQIRENGVFLDEALCVFFPAPHSYTGEDAAEFQCHGGPLLVQKVFWAVLKSGARLAHKGEFTLRAFLNGRIDLTQAEAVLDLIEAKTSASLKMAGEQLEGRLYRALQPLEDEFLALLARVSAAVDFPEEAESIDERSLETEIRALAAKTRSLLESAESGQLYREGIEAVLLGAVNSGKSSLLNALLEEEKAIVTPLPGTTRDVVEGYLDLEGLPLLLADTAGIRRARDEAEKMGINKSRQRAAAAQLLLFVADCSDTSLAGAEMIKEYSGQKLLVVINKIDIGDISLWRDFLKREHQDLPWVAVSAKSGAGLPELKKAIAEIFLKGADTKETPLSGNFRHRQALDFALKHLNRAETALKEGLPLDIAGLDLGDAWLALGQISGKTAAKDVLERIFADFCLGK
jgi:tRNA modification GTPase